MVNKNTNLFNDFVPDLCSIKMTEYTKSCLACNNFGPYFNYIRGASFYLAFQQLKKKKIYVKCEQL